MFNRPENFVFLHPMLTLIFVAGAEGERGCLVINLGYLSFEIKPLNGWKRHRSAMKFWDNC